MDLTVNEHLVPIVTVCVLNLNVKRVLFLQHVPPGVPFYREECAE